MTDDPRDDELAAHLADERDDLSRRAFERRLRDDPELAARLERVRRVDAALGAMPPPPTLLDTDELRRAVQRELDRTPVDELAGARSRRRARIPGWVGGAAAAAVLVVVGAQVLPDLGSGSSDDSAESALGEDAVAGDEAGGDAASELTEDGAAAVAGPALLDSGRALDGDDLPALAADAPPVQDVLLQPLLAPDVAFERPEALIDDSSDAMTTDDSTEAEAVEPNAARGADGDETGNAGTDTADREEGEDADGGAGRFAAGVAEGRAVIADAYGDDGAAVVACLATVADDDVLLLVDRVQVDGAAAVVAVFEEVIDGAVTGRRLTWALDLASCDVLRYVPGGAIPGTGDPEG